MTERHDPHRTLPYSEVQEEGLADWRFLLGALRGRFETGSFAVGLDLVTRVGALADEVDQHSVVVLTGSWVELTLSSLEGGGVTARDVDLARRITAAAAAIGVVPTPGQVTALECCLDVPAPADVMAFWATALGLDVAPDQDAVVDRSGRLPAIWFQDAPGAIGEVQQRFHADVWVPRELAEDRFAAAVAAGGTLVSDDEAPAFWLLADQHGNKVCICTADGRG